MQQLRSIHALAASAAISVVTACGTAAPASLAHAEQVAGSCPAGSRVAALVQSDESGTSRGATASPARQSVIREVAERTAICGGHLRVTLFSGSMIGITVFDGDLQLDGATDNARLRKAPKVIDGVMDQLNAELPDATAQLTDGATDIVGQYQHGSDYQAQFAASGNVHLEQTILTDGIQTASQDLSNTDLTDAEATTLAATFAVPRLSDTQVRLIGIGRQADDAPLPTPYIDALRAFHRAVCQRTGAQCTVVTDAAGA
ncbi:hypothetical protein [Mycolicibacterium cosmeticum]|uniref:hypothetical protein n=1 Tax=Mycolicibacterium cosmeticum TaxID=258533 RepID=UPI003204C020